MKTNEYAGQFEFEQPACEPKPSILNDEHLNVTTKQHMAPFAGYIMPLWYRSISAEHNAVRQRAGIFDCTHMGILEISGSRSGQFIDFITTNHYLSMKTGKARYGYILDAAGNILDDIIVYRRSSENFMMVVNAANEAKIKTYLEKLSTNQVVIDVDEPNRKLESRPEIRDMRDSSVNSDCRVDIALQGPASIELLGLLSPQLNENLKGLKPFHFIETAVADLDCIIARTGYTGSNIGFELFVHPANAAILWRQLVSKGKSLGVEPCGLGARDSLRIEAGLPLYGHELAGEYNISPFEAGYGWAVKLEKDFFIGKTAMQKNAEDYSMKVCRFEFPGVKGIRPARPYDGILNSKEKCVGWVLSGATINEKQIILGFIDRVTADSDTNFGVYYTARSENQIKKGRPKTIEKEKKFDTDINGIQVERFAKF